MRISEQWLRRLVELDDKTDVDTASLAEQLTMAGLEVDKVEAVDEFGDAVVVGEVVALDDHPEADKLKVARVNVGDGGEPLQIVCGASNVAVGLRAPTALPGAELPGGVKIGATALRGVESSGMLCSAKELGLSEDGAGLMALPDDAEPGVPLRQLLSLDDAVIEIDLTPNRGDCLGMEGVAREVGVLNRCAVTPPSIEPVVAAHEQRFPVTLSNPEACPRFVSRVIRGVNARAATPLWMTERLRRAGVRSLGPLIDVTNYVMLELNHPMHAYDLNKLSGGIDVRYAKPGERVELLNGQGVEADAETLLITDASGAIGLAGIMGGATTECDDDTRDVLLECAFFSPERIAGRARRYGLHTDASHRFERGVDPRGQTRAVERATRLLIDMAGGEAGPLVDTAVEQALPKPQPIHFRAARLKLLLGVDVPAEVVSDVLTRLGLSVEPLADGWRVTPPSFRADLRMEADLVEEVGRVYGYQHLPVGRSAEHSRQRATPIPERRIDERRLREALLARGYQETINYSFIEAGLQQSLDPEHPPLALANPISSEMAVMRTSLWPGLLKTLVYNQKRQQPRLRLYEIGQCFVGGFDALRQTSSVAGVMLGAALPEQWGEARRAADFFDLKGDVEALLALAGRDPSRAFRFTADRHPALHPGQSARIEAQDFDLDGDSDNGLVGWLGALHPRLARELDVDGRALLFELRVDAVLQGRIPTARSLSKFPASRRDLSLLVAENVAAETLRDSILELGGGLLQELVLFDVYQGKGTPEGQKSLTFGLILQDFSRNLTDQAVADQIAVILTGLAQRHAVTLRD